MHPLQQAEMIIQQQQPNVAGAKSHEFCLLHLQRGKSRCQYHRCGNGNRSHLAPQKNNVEEEQGKKILPLVEQSPGTPSPTLFKGKVFEGAATTHKRKNHSAVHPTSCADCCQISGKVTHRRENKNFKIIINELLLTIGKKNASRLYK